jgi:hypothetical protein
MGILGVWDEIWWSMKHPETCLQTLQMRTDYLYLYTPLRQFTFFRLEMLACIWLKTTSCHLNSLYLGYLFVVNEMASCCSLKFSRHFQIYVYKVWENIWIHFLDWWFKMPSTPESDEVTRFEYKGIQSAMSKLLKNL